METNSSQYEHVFQTARSLIAKYLRVPETEIQPESHIMDDLGADSLALVELGFQISETFHVPVADTSGDKLVFKHLVEYIVETMAIDTH